MRVLIATAYRHMVGGVEKYLQLLIPGLLETGHSVGLLYEYPAAEGQEFIDPEQARVPSWCARDLGTAAALGSLAEWEPDLVYLHGLDDGSLEDALVRRYPAILYAHTYNGTCVSGRKCHAFPTLQPCSRKLGPGCLLHYYPRRCGGLHPVTMWNMYREQTNRRERLARYSSILVASRHMRREIAQHGVPAHRLRLVALPVTSHVAATAPPAPKRPEGRILFLGRLVDVKGAGYLIRAIPEATKRLGRPLHVTIAGDGAEREKVRMLAQECNVDLDFTGWLDAGQRNDLLGRCDLLAVPSVWPEPFGLVGIEAGCFGLPAVGYDVGGIADWLAAGRSGELAPGDPPTVHGLADAIVRALADPEHYAALCRGAWKISTGFTLQRHLAQLENVFAECAVPRISEQAVHPTI